MSKRHAFAPGHVTGFFAVHDGYEDLSHKGSRGGGWSLERGAYAAVESADATHIASDGLPMDAPVTKDALRRLAPDEQFHVDLVHQLPMSQGFGMSAAGSLAACLAAANLLDLEPDLALKAAHEAEVAAGTGLGDAVGSWFGGGELRIKPGCPPQGWAMHIHAPDEASFLFCTLGDPIDTGRIIRDPDWKERTRRYGDPAVDRLLEGGRDKAWTELLHESASFSRALGLAPAAMLELGKQLPDDLVWGQVMLGSTMWVYGLPGDLDRAEAMLEGHGPLLRAKVEPNGARLVRSMPAAMV